MVELKIKKRNDDLTKECVFKLIYEDDEGKSDAEECLTEHGK